MLWKDSLSGAYLSSIFANGAGELFVSGSFTGSVDMDPGIGSNVLSGGGSFVGKYTTNGTHIWGKKIVGTSIRDITVDALGNVFSCGIGGGATVQNTIAKWDANGNFQWMNFFHSNVIFGCSDISLSCNNEIVITGITDSEVVQNYDPLGGTYTCTPNSSSGFYGTIFNYFAAYSPSNGSIIWAKCVGGYITRIAHVYNGSTMLPLSSSFIDNSGSIYLISRVIDAGGLFVNDFDPNAGVVTFSTSPTPLYTFFAKYTGCGAVGIDDYNDANTISISPNPSSDKFIFSNLIGENKIEIMDITGRLILTDEIKYSSYTLSMDDLPRGMYFYKITDAKGQLKQGKLLLQ